MTKPKKSDDPPAIATSSIIVDNTLYEEVLYEGKPCFAFIGMTERSKVNGEIKYCQKIVDKDGIEYIPHAGEELAKKVVLLPTRALSLFTVEEIVLEIKEFVHRYCDIPQDFQNLAAYYVLLTYVYDRLDQICYLSFLGDTGTGKSRCKIAIGALCYTPLLASGGTSSAAIYRLIDKWKGTLLLDEADFSQSDEKQEIVKLLNCGFEKHSPRIVCDKESPTTLQFHNPYCPKIISRRFEYADKALESRCLTLRTTQTGRQDILRVLPEAFWKDAENIRNKLITFRLVHWEKFKNPSTNILSDLKLEPRLEQANTSLAIVLQPFEEFENFKGYLIKKQAELIEERANTVEGALVQAYCTNGEKPITATELCLRASEFLNDEIKVRSAGRKLKALGFNSTLRKEDGKVARKISIEAGKLVALKERYGVYVTDVTDVTNVTKPATETEKGNNGNIGNNGNVHTPHAANVVSMVRALDSGAGADYAEVVAKTSEDAVLMALTQGEVFESRKGRLKVLE